MLIYDVSLLYQGSTRKTVAILLIQSEGMLLLEAAPASHSAVNLASVPYAFGSEG